MSRFDTPSIDPANSYRNNVDTTRENLNALDDDRVSHENDPEAHGLDDTKADLSSVKSEVETARDAFSSLDNRLDNQDSNLDTVEQEVIDGRGSKSTLNNRLKVGLNPDGSIRLGNLVSVFQDPKWSLTFVDSTTFKVDGLDVTSQLQADMLLRFTVDGSYVFGVITSTSFSGGDTTVNIRSQDDVLTSNLTKAEIALVAYQDYASSIAANSADITQLKADAVKFTGSSSTDNALPRFDGTNGIEFQSSSVVVDDDDNISGHGQAVESRASDFTLSASEAGKVEECASGAAFTITVPSNSNVALPVGYTMTAVQADGNLVTFSPQAGVTLNSKDGNTSTNGQWTAATLYKRATDEWVIVGGLS